MNCETVQNLLSERLDAALPDESERIVASHLSACPPCAALDRRLAILVEDLASLRAVDVPEGLRERILERVPPPRLLAHAERRREPHELRRVAGWAAVMAMASLALLGRGVTGRLADGLAPVIAGARQEMAASRLAGTSLLSGLDRRGEAELQRLTAGSRGSRGQQ